MFELARAILGDDLIRDMANKAAGPIAKKLEDFSRSELGQELKAQPKDMLPEEQLLGAVRAIIRKKIIK